MAVDETSRDHLRLIHICDQIANVISGLTAEEEVDSEKKKNVGNMVMMLECELLDDKWGSFDMSRLTAACSAGRTFWKS